MQTRAFFPTGMHATFRRLRSVRPDATVRRRLALRLPLRDRVADGRTRALA